MAIGSVTNNEIKKPKQENQANPANPAAPAVPEGDHTKKDKAQNTDVFYNHLDTQQQEAMKKAIGNNKWASPDKVAQSLKDAGYEATVGKEGKTTYLEVTGKDGQKYKIWDVGGDNGIGTQDIAFNGQLDNFKNDVKGLNNNKDAAKVQNNDPFAPKAQAADPFNGQNAYKNYLEYLIGNLKNNLAGIDKNDDNQKVEQQSIEDELQVLLNQYYALN